jgi:hypothetical protein
MSQPAVPLPGRLDRIKVLAAESTRMNDQLLAGALAQDRQLEVIGVEPKPPSILAARSPAETPYDSDQLGFA